jgi:hypothetical protein
LSPPTLCCLGWSRSCAPKTSWIASRGAPWGVSSGMEAELQGQRPDRSPTGTARDAVPPSLHARDPALENDSDGGRWPAWSSAIDSGLNSSASTRRPLLPPEHH